MKLSPVASVPADAFWNLSSLEVWFIPFVMLLASFHILATYIFFHHPILVDTCTLPPKPGKEDFSFYNCNYDESDYEPSCTLHVVSDSVCMFMCMLFLIRGETELKLCITEGSARVPRMTRTMQLQFLRHAE